MAAKKKAAPKKLNSIVAAQQAIAKGVPPELVNSADSIALLAFANGTHPWFKQQQAGAAQAAIAPAAPAPQAAAPAAAAPVNPFLTPEQQMAADDALFGLNDSLYNLGKQYTDLEANTKYETAGVNKREQENNAAAVENMIARGLFRSSIKDSELADVAASAQARRDYLSTTLETARIDRDTRTNKIEARKREMFGTDGTTALGGGGTYDQIAVQNAQAIEPVIAPTTPGVDTGPLATGAKPDPGQKKVAVNPQKAKQAAAASFADRNAREEQKAAKSESQSRNKKGAKPRKPGMTSVFKAGKGKL